jgi:thiosulfate dehydrogenase (quinone) large subunit
MGDLSLTGVTSMADKNEADRGGKGPGVDKSVRPAVPPEQGNDAESAYAGVPRDWASAADLRTANAGGGRFGGGPTNEASYGGDPATARPGTASPGEPPAEHEADHSEGAEPTDAGSPEGPPQERGEDTGGWQTGNDAGAEQRADPPAPAESAAPAHDAQVRAEPDADERAAYGRVVSDADERAAHERVVPDADERAAHERVVPDADERGEHERVGPDAERGAAATDEPTADEPAGDDRFEPAPAETIEPDGPRTAPRDEALPVADRPPREDPAWNRASGVSPITRGERRAAQAAAAARAVGVSETGGAFGQAVWAIVRLLLGFLFLWAFLDRLFGFGQPTDGSAAWREGGSPTTGYLRSVTGPVAGIAHDLAGQSWVDWVFMIGIAAIGVALIFGVCVRIAAIAGALIMVALWLTSLPIGDNPFANQYLIYALVLVGLAATGVGLRYSLAPWWRRTVARRLRFLR